MQIRKGKDVGNASMPLYKADSALCRFSSVKPTFNIEGVTV